MTQASAPHATGPVRFVARRARFAVGRLVVLELAGGLVLAAYGRSVTLALLAVPVAVALAVVVLGRSGGRWWTERLALRWRYGRRRAARPVPATDPRLAALTRLVPELSVRTVDDRGTPVGVGQDAAGWFATVAVRHGGGLPLAELTRIFDGSGPPASALSVVTHAVPTPSFLLDRQQPAARSYLELAGQDGAAAADSVCWVSVRLDPRSASEAAYSRGGGLDGVHRALCTLVGRVTKAVTGAGLECQVLDTDELLDALVRSAGAAGVPDLAGGGVAERWTNWRADGLAHTCFAVSHWPPLAGVNGMLGRLVRTPAALVSVVLLAEPGAAPEDVTLRGLVRVAAEPAALDDACRAARATVRTAGGRLRRLDGEQGPALYASLPTGGGSS